MIVRSARPRANFTILDNAVIRNPDLSFKARGILAYLLSLPDGWRIDRDQLARQSTDGQTSIRSGLAELEQARYIRRVKRQDNAGRWSTLTIVYDTPQPVDNPVDNGVDNLLITEPPAVDYPPSGNPPSLEVLKNNDVDGFISPRTYIQTVDNSNGAT